MLMAGFDAKKNDQGYASVLENKGSQMASSHQMKRFFAKLSIIPNKLFRYILHKLFVWRLKIEKPKVIILGIERTKYSAKLMRTMPSAKMSNFGLSVVHTGRSMVFSALVRSGLPMYLPSRKMVA
jgi:hypothetical protein